MKTCANPICGFEFEPKRSDQKYCKRSCCHNHWCTLHRDEITARGRKWREKNPEKVKQTTLKRAAKLYRAGKLPSWMYS